jgi:hypothetical protein
MWYTICRESSGKKLNSCGWSVDMYRMPIAEQLRLELPFGVRLNVENRWVKLASLMPWDRIEEEYSKNFKGRKGQVAKPGRLAFAALYIQNRLDITDEETVVQIMENPYMQYFCGFECYTIEKPFDSSLMVHFRKRISAEMIRDISEDVFASEALKAIEEASSNNNNNNNNDDDDDDDDDDDGDSSDKSNNVSNSVDSGKGDNGGNTKTEDESTNSSSDNGEETVRPKGTMLLDATCCPSDIRYPTDISLLNHARELTEEMIDILQRQLVPFNFIKPETLSEMARKDFMEYVKKRRHTPEELRYHIGQQLLYVKRNLDSIDKQIELGAKPEKLGKALHEKLSVIKELYRQQKQMYDEETHKIDDRIVSISQPHLRPIVRGKANAPVEFGAKVATAHIGGFTFVIHIGYDNFSEAKYLEKSAEEYKRIFGFYPETIIGDKAYTTNENRNYCKSKGIRLSAPKRGRMTKEAKEAQRKQLYEDNCKRNAVEGDYGTGKRKYGLGLIMTKLYETTLTAISFGFFVKNMERVLRLFVLQFFKKVTFYFPKYQNSIARFC